MQATPSADVRESIAFTSYRLDRRSGRLTHGGKTIPLRPKTWAVLLYLAERPGMLVTKNELLDAVWPDVAVTPDTLTKSIGELRLALGDDSKMPHCIETVHRRGFRFIAGTEVSGSGSLVPGFREDRPETRDQQPRTSWFDAGTGVSGSGSLVSGFGEDQPETRDQQPGTSWFVGRSKELQQLRAWFATARTGKRQIGFITGPVGVGKTGLVESFLDSAAVRAAAPVWVGRGTCVEQHGTREPYMPVLDALERLMRRPDAASLVGLLRRTAPTWLAQLPWLLGDDADVLRQSLQAARPERMLREFAALVEALTAAVPVVLVLEDLHWSDTSTVDLLSVIAQRREPARLLVIGTYRPADVAMREPVLSQAVQTLQMRRQCLNLPLHELTMDDVGHYLDARFSGAEFASTLAPIVHRYTNGNPLFVVAVVDHMRSRGLILDTAPGWALSASPEKLQLEVPDDVGRMIEMQFESLSPADRSLLYAASAVGPEFAVQPVAAALQWRVDETEVRCEALRRSPGVLRAIGNTEWPDGSMTRRYAFTHELYRQAAYAEIPEGQRQRLHQRIGEALRSRPKPRVLNSPTRHNGPSGAPAKASSRARSRR